MKCSKPLKSGGRIKPNWKRRDANFVRQYGSSARVLFVKSLPCCWCATTQEERQNCHLPSRSGMGRKGDFTTVVPMCGSCHDRLDGRAYPRPTESEMEMFWHIAEQVQADWLDYVARITR